MAEEITIAREGARVEGRVVRKGAEILRITGEFRESADVSYYGRYTPVVTDLEGRPAALVTHFIYKYSMRSDGRGFDYVPRLIRLATLIRPREGTLEGSGEVVLRSTPSDPLGEVPAREVVWMTYGISDSEMTLGRVIARAWNVLAFAPRALWKSDYFFHVPGDGQGPMARRERKALLKRMKAY